MKQLHENSNFVVKDNATIYIILGVLFLCIFFFSLTDKIPYDYDGVIKFKFLYLTIVPAFFFIWKAFMKKSEIILINKNGFYYYGELITTWRYFVDAEVTQEEKIFTLQDNFVLFIRYKNQEGKLFRSKFPLRNTQDKSEEEIIAAIKFFSARKQIFF